MFQDGIGAVIIAGGIAYGIAAASGNGVFTASQDQSGESTISRPEGAKFIRLQPNREN